ncbi:MAG: YdcF family protein [Planctomycetaceae bacterium]
MKDLLRTLLLPPLGLFLLGAAGLLCGRRRPRRRLWLLGLAAGGLYLLSMPLVSGALLRSLENDPPLPPGPLDPAVGAIVILSGDIKAHAPEYGGPTLGPLTLERVRYGVKLAKESGRPVLVTGGVVQEGTPPVALLMKEAMEREWGVAVRWVETRSRDTTENARFSAEILRAEGITTVLLVTHGWHLPRARSAFEAAGLRVVAAPTGFRGPASFFPSLLASPKAMRDSHFALHEWLGRLWYALSGAR